jgi:hypothetical protein
MLLMLLGAVAVLWLSVAAVMISLCVSAARADRTTARPLGAPAPRPGLRLIA